MLLELRPTSAIAGDIISKVVDGCLKQLDAVSRVVAQERSSLISVDSPIRPDSTPESHILTQLLTTRR
jgi:hypothetical protein